MFSCLQILEAFLWFVLITLLNVTLIILTLSVSRLLNLLLRLVAFLLFLNPQCLADRKSGSAGMPRPNSYAVFCLKKKTKRKRCWTTKTFGSSACQRLARLQMDMRACAMRATKCSEHW